MHVLGFNFINFKSILVESTNAFTIVEFGMFSLILIWILENIKYSNACFLQLDSKYLFNVKVEKKFS